MLKKFYLLLSAIIILFVLNPVKAEAATTITTNTTIASDRVFDGDLIIADNVTLTISNCTLTVKGNMYADGNVRVGTSILNVTGDYVQRSRTISCDSGEINVGGNFRLQNYVSSTYRAGSGTLSMTNSGGVLNVGDSVYINSSGGFTNYGKTNIKNDYIQTDGSGGRVQINNLTFTSTGAQANKLITSTANKRSTYKNVKLSNIGKKLEVGGYVYLELADDIYELTTSDDVITIDLLILNGHSCYIPGTVVARGDIGGGYYTYGCVQVGDGSLRVGGDYIQAEEFINVDNGSFDVDGNFYVTGYNNGSYSSGSGYFRISKSTGYITVGGSLYYNSSSSSQNVNGQLNICGDLIQLEGNTGKLDISTLNLVNYSKVYFNVRENYIRKLVSTVKAVEVDGIMDITLGSDMTIYPKNGSVNFQKLELNGYNCTVEGDLHAVAKTNGWYSYGNVQVGKGQLTVNGDYYQETVDTSLNGGTINIAGNLQVDNDGYIYTSTQAGTINIGKQFLYNSEKQSDIKCTVVACGNVQQSPESIGTLNLKQLIMKNENTAIIQVLKGKITDLYVSSDMSKYIILPNDCYVNLYYLREGISPEADGNYYLYLNGQLASNYTGIYNDSVYGLWMIVNGKIAFDYNGVYSDVKFGRMLIQNGAVATYYNDLYCDATLGWVKIVNGSFDSTYNDLYCSPTLGWWKVSNGYLDMAYCDIYNSPTLGAWKISFGQIDFGYSELYCSPSVGWYKIYCGMVDVNYNDLYCSPVFGWYKIKDGAVDFSYCDMYLSPSLGWWKVAYGALDLNYNDVYFSNVLNAYFKIAGGAIDWNYSDLYLSSFGWWKVRTGILDLDYNGIYDSPTMGKWLITWGGINFYYDGVYVDPVIGAWYCKGGTIDYSYTGRVITNGVTYDVVNGRATVASPLRTGIQGENAGGTDIEAPATPVDEEAQEEPAIGEEPEAEEAEVEAI